MCIDYRLAYGIGWGNKREGGGTGEPAIVVIQARDDADLADQQEKQKWKKEK